MDLSDILQIIGSALIADDKNDIGKFDRIHHWQIGLLMLMAPEFMEDQE